LPLATARKARADDHAIADVWGFRHGDTAYAARLLALLNAAGRSGAFDARMSPGSTRWHVMIEPADRAHIITRAVAAPVAPAHRGAT
jgi:hypothetical protein